MDVEALHIKHPYEKSVFQFYKRDISHDLKPDVTSNSPRWYFFESYHWNEVILDETAYENDAVVRFKLGREEKIRHFAAHVTYPDQTQKLFKRKDLNRKRIAVDSSAYELVVDVLPEGAYVEVVYEIERKKLLKDPPLSHNVPLQFDRPVEHMEFAYTYPAHWEVQLKKEAPGRFIELEKSLNEKAETQTYAYRNTNVAAFHKEMYGPHLKQVGPYFHVKVNRLEVGNVLEWTGKPSWERVAEKHASITNASKRTQNSAKERIKQLGIDPAMSAVERISIIKSHIESEIEVVAAPGKRGIWKSKKGDPLDVAVYMSVLLEAAEISTDFLLAHTAEEGYFDDAFISHEQFYAPVLRTNLEGRETYLFPNKKGIPLGYVPVEYANQVALAYSDNEYEGIQTMISAPEVAYRDEANYKLFVNEDGKVRSEVAMELGLHTQYRLNQALLHQGESETSLVENLLAHDAAHIEGLVYHFNMEDPIYGGMLNASYELSGCFGTANKQVTIQSCGLFDPINTKWYPLIEGRNTNPVLPADIRVTNHVQVIYPDTWTISNLMPNVAEKGKRVIFERTFAQKSGQLDINQHVLFQRQAARSIVNPVLAHSFQLPLGTTLTSIKLDTTPQLAIIDLPSIKEGPWTLIVETYDSYEAAVDKVIELESSSSVDAIPVRILSDGLIDDKYHVLLGNFSSRTDVETARAVLARELPFDSWIALINPQMTAVLNAEEPITY